MLAYILRSACSDARPKWQESHLWSRFYATFSGYPDGERKHWRNHRGHWGHVPLSPKIKAYIVTHSGAKMRQNTSFQHTQKMKKILRWRHKLPHNPLIRPFPWWERDPSYTHFLRALYIQITGYATEEEFDGTYRALLLARIWWSASLSFSAGQPQTVLIFFFRSTRNMAQVCHLSSVSVYATTDYTLCPKKHPRHFQLYLENQLPNFNNFWRKYSWHNLPSNDHSVVHLTQCMLLHYLGKADQPKYALK